MLDGLPYPSRAEASWGSSAPPAHPGSEVRVCRSPGGRRPHGPAPGALLCPLCGSLRAGLPTQRPGHPGGRVPRPAPPHPQPGLRPPPELLGPAADDLSAPKGGGGPGQGSLAPAGRALPGLCSGPLRPALRGRGLPGGPELRPLPGRRLPLGLPSHPEALLHLGGMCGHMGLCSLPPGAGLRVEGPRRPEGQCHQLPGRQHGGQRLPRVPGGLGPGLSRPFPARPLHRALLSAPGHHGLLLCWLPPGAGRLRSEPPAEAQGSLGSRGRSAHAAALLGALPRLQRGWLPAPQLGKLLEEAGAHYCCLERGAQPLGDWLPGRGHQSGYSVRTKNKRGDISEVVAAAGDQGLGATSPGPPREIAPKEQQGGLVGSHSRSCLGEELSLAEDCLPGRGRNGDLETRAQEEGLLNLFNALMKQMWDLILQGDPNGQETSGKIWNSANDCSWGPFWEVAVTMDTGQGNLDFPGSHWLNFSVYLFIFVVGLPLNLLALLIFVGKLRQRPVAVDVLLLNLTISDLVLLFFLPFRMVEAASGMLWLLPFIFCPLSGFLFFTTIYLTSLFLAAVSVERFLSVAYPVWYMNRPRLGQAGVVSVLCWLLAGAHCSIVYVTEYLGNNVNNQSENKTCYQEFQPKQLAILLPVRLEMALVLFGVPLIITIYCYSRLVFILKQGMSQHRQKRVAGLAAATLINFIVLFGPYNISHIVGYIQGQSPVWRNYVLLLSSLNSCVDPLVYYFSSSGFQADFHRLLGKLTGAWGLCRQGRAKLKENTEQERGSSMKEQSNVENSASWNCAAGYGVGQCPAQGWQDLEVVGGD